jgi:hypothetical protein
MLEILPSIRHLTPPSACGPLRLDRFSPYHSHPERYGLRNLRPQAAYHHLYPFAGEALSRIAYYFDFDYAPGEDPSAYSEQVRAYCEQWRATPDPGTLTAVRRPDGSLGLLDTRSGRVSSGLIVNGLAQRIYEFCDAAHSLPGIVRETGATEADVRPILDHAVANRFMVTDGTRYLSLAQATRPLRRQWEDRPSPAVHSSSSPFSLIAISATSLGNSHVNT